ncbi:MAG: hypothetical protein U0R77_05870 [Mycolicibacterium insubricum]
MDQIGTRRRRDRRPNPAGADTDVQAVPVVVRWGECGGDGISKVFAGGLRDRCLYRVLWAPV